jgi:5-methylcytosine-specific restriction endonuclease McrA
VCGAPATEVDHIRPVNAGGSDAPTNLRAVCRRHNPRGADPR